MESPKRGCDLGPCVVKNASVQKTHCDHFLRFKDFPRCQVLRLGRLRSKNAAFCVCVSKPAKVVRFPPPPKIVRYALPPPPLRFRRLLLGVDQPSHRKIAQVCELCSGARV